MRRLAAEDPKQFFALREGAANYFRTYVERDVRQLMEIRNLSLFENFIRLLAGRIGQPLNLSSLSADVGVSGTTLKEWLSYASGPFRSTSSRWSQTRTRSPCWLLTVNRSLTMPWLGRL